ncbi:MAG: bifunctional phosphoserine phosphatase/homoserine phosphotransferase ThrH [Candidatus Helarchaeales archaeon]
MFIVCFDLEGVFTPEVWISVAEKTGIEELRLTTRDLPDYDMLMKRRLEILREHKITLQDIQSIITSMELLPGAREFSDWIRSVAQVIILSDTFIEFGMPFMKKLGYPTLLCHDLEVDENGMIVNYRLRIRDMKRQTVIAFKNLNYDVIAIGDSYNDTGMLAEATRGILFRPPENVIKEFPAFPVVKSYSELKDLLSKYLSISK